MIQCEENFLPLPYSAKMGWNAEQINKINYLWRIQIGTVFQPRVVKSY